MTMTALPEIDGHRIAISQIERDETWRVWCSCYDGAPDDEARFAYGAGEDEERAILDYADRHLRSVATTIEHQLVIDSTLAVIPLDDPADPDWRAAEVPAGRHAIAVITDEHGERTAFPQPHPLGAIDTVRCEAFTAAWLAFWHSNTVWPEPGLYWADVDDDGNLAIGGRAHP